MQVFLRSFGGGAFGVVGVVGVVGGGLAALSALGSSWIVILFIDYDS